MLASQAGLLSDVVAALNSAIGSNSALTGAGVRVTQVNMTLPDSRPVVLTWDPTAGEPDPSTGAIPGDWIVTATE